MAIPGHCIDIDDDSWHRDGDRCEDCGFGCGAGNWSEPTVELLCGPVRPDLLPLSADKGGARSAQQAPNQRILPAFSSMGPI